MIPDPTIKKWQQVLIQDAKTKLGRSLKDHEKKFITSRGGMIALEMIHDTIKSASKNKLEAYLSSEHKDNPTTASSDPRDDPYDLNRFTQAQERVYDDVLAELKRGRKQTHWMWFIFPQIVGLGFSSTSKRYAIKSLAEARQYLNHPVLGPRLLECTKTVLAIEGRTASEIFGYPDDLKFASSMTLFECVADPDSVFARALEKYFHGKRDKETLTLLGMRKS